MKRVAAIDIGTNSTRLLFAEMNRSELTALETGLFTTRLGEGIGSGFLLPEAMARTAAAVGEFHARSLALGADRVVIAATSAVRDASNRDVFLNMIKEKTGCRVRVLSGQEEAALSYRGVLSGLDIEPASSVVMDVGGGSTEFIWTEGEQLRMASVNAGAVRMSGKQCSEVEAESILRPALEGLGRAAPTNLVGVGGTVTTLAAIDQGLVRYRPELVHGYSLSLSSVRNILTMLSEMDLDARRRVPGLQPERADVIVAGVTIVKIIMSVLGLNRMTVSECDILHGLVLKEVETK